jgi:hypothetical protein
VLAENIIKSSPSTAKYLHHTTSFYGAMIQTNLFQRQHQQENTSYQLHNFYFVAKFSGVELAGASYSAADYEAAADATGGRQALVVAAREKKTLCPVVLKVCLTFYAL